MNIVFDSNVWISALHFRGTPLTALSKALEWDRIACCHEIRTEIQRALVVRLNWEPRNALIAMEQYFVGSIDVVITGAVTGVCRDPKDDMILECA